MVLDRTEFSKKQWSARAVRRCIDCVETGVDPKLCTHGRGIFDCEACLEEDNALKLKAAAKRDLERPISRVWKLDEFPCERIFFGTKLVTDAIVQISPSAVIINCEHDVYIHSMDIREFRWSKTIFSPLHNRKAYDFFAIRVDPFTKRISSLVSALPDDFDPTDTDGPRRHIVGLVQGEVFTRILGEAVPMMQGEGREHGWAECNVRGLCADDHVEYLEGVRAAEFAENCRRTSRGEQACANCGRGDASKTCGRCMARAYCSTECQRADWKRHKSSCQSVEGPEASADAKAGLDPSRGGLEQSDLFQAIHKAVVASAAGGVTGFEDSPIFPEFTKAVATYTQFSLNAIHGRLMKRLAHDLLLSASDEDILDTIKAAGGAPSEERSLFLRQYRVILELKARSEQVDKSKQEMQKVNELLTQFVLESPEAAFPPQYLHKLMDDGVRAYERQRQREKKAERRQCDVCDRQGPTSEARFMLCAGCGKRRYCSEFCQEKDWRENGHKITCMPISDFVCRVTQGCRAPERDYCDVCAETFCLDCEFFPRPCAECGLYSCGSREEHKFGPMDELCPLISWCSVCETSYCEWCREADFCHDCDNDFCADCRLVVTCNNCDKTICTKCSYGNEEIGIPHMCRDCVGAAIPADQALYAAYDTITKRGAAVGAGPWSSGERQALSLVFGGLPQPCLREVWEIMGLEGLPFPDGDNILNFESLPASVCDRAHLCVFALAKVPVDDDVLASFDTLADALADRVGTLEAKP